MKMMMMVDGGNVGDTNGHINETQDGMTVTDNL